MPKSEGFGVVAGFSERRVRRFSFLLVVVWRLRPLLLIDIVKRERETQAACVLAGSGVTWGCKETTIECVF